MAASRSAAARSACAATACAAAALRRDADGFGIGKLATAHFYAEHFLARAPSYLPGVMGGATVVGFDPEMFG